MYESSSLPVLQRNTQLAPRSERHPRSAMAPWGTWRRPAASSTQWTFHSAGAVSVTASGSVLAQHSADLCTPSYGRGSVDLVPSDATVQSQLQSQLPFCPDCGRCSFHVLAASNAAGAMLLLFPERLAPRTPRAPPPRPRRTASRESKMPAACCKPGTPLPDGYSWALWCFR